MFTPMTFFVPDTLGEANERSAQLRTEAREWRLLRRSPGNRRPGLRRSTPSS